MNTTTLKLRIIGDMSVAHVQIYIVARGEVAYEVVMFIVYHAYHGHTERKR